MISTCSKQIYHVIMFVVTKKMKYDMDGSNFEFEAIDSHVDALVNLIKDWNTNSWSNYHHLIWILAHHLKNARVAGDMTHICTFAFTMCTRHLSSRVLVLCVCIRQIISMRKMISTGACAMCMRHTVSTCARTMCMH